MHELFDILYTMEMPVSLVRPFDRGKPGLLALADEALRLMQGKDDIVDFEPLSDKAFEFFCGCNLVALIEHYYGTGDRAYHLCLEEIAVCERMRAAGHSHLWAEHAIEAYVNIGRLAAMHGQTEKAIECFQKVFRYAMGKEDLHLGSFSISHSMLEGAPSVVKETANGLLKRLSALSVICVRESIKAFLIAHDYTRLISFLRDLDLVFAKGNRTVYALIQEALAKGLSGLGRSVEAKDALNRSLAYLEDNPSARLRLKLMCADFDRQHGQYECARQQVIDIAADVQTVLQDNCLDKWHTLYRAALSLSFMGCYEDSIRLCKLSKECLTSNNNEVPNISTNILHLLTLSACGKEEDAQVEYTSLSQLAATSYYRVESSLCYLTLACCRRSDSTGDLKQHFGAAALSRLLAVESPLSKTLIKIVQEQTGVGPSSQKKVPAFYCSLLDDLYCRVLNILQSTCNATPLSTVHVAC